MRQCLFADLDHNSVEEVRRTKHLGQRCEDRGTSAKEKQIEVVAAQAGQMNNLSLPSTSVTEGS